MQYMNRDMNDFHIKFSDFLLSFRHPEDYWFEKII